MKLDGHRIAAFLRDPGPVRVVLLHGDDEGMVRHRADALTLAVVGQRDDPFRVAWLSREEHARVEEEASAIAMLGGRRVIRVRDAGDALTAAMQRVLETGGDSMVVLEAALLPGRSKLRGLIEQSPLGAAAACYPEEAATLRQAIETGLAQAGITVERDAAAWLMQHLGSDRASTRGELEKLILYAGADRRLDLEAVEACVGDQGATSLDDAVFGVVAGDTTLVDRSLERALLEGAAPVAVCRAMLGLLTKLQLAAEAMRRGASADEAVRGLRPPVFFKRVAGFAAALPSWPPRRIQHGLSVVTGVELACKQSGAPDALLVRRMMLDLAQGDKAEPAGRLSGRHGL